jgi:hypothetical protein
MKAVPSALLWDRHLFLRSLGLRSLCQQEVRDTQGRVGNEYSWNVLLGIRIILVVHQSAKKGCHRKANTRAGHGIARTHLHNAHTTPHSHEQGFRHKEIGTRMKGLPSWL